MKRITVGVILVSGVQSVVTLAYIYALVRLLPYLVRVLPIGEVWLIVAIFGAIVGISIAATTIWIIIH